MASSTTASENSNTVRIIALFLTILLLAGCRQQQQGNAENGAGKESKEAKTLLQGVWMDMENEEVAFRAIGDTIYFPDSTSMPAYFRIVGDSLLLGAQHYPIVKQTPHLFSFLNQNGDTVKLSKCDNPDDLQSLEEETPTQPKPITMDRVVKTDSVVMYGAQRYHWYIAVTPTRYKVVKTTYNDDGVGVENSYYDNNIHISIFQGTRRLFGRDFRKAMYDSQVPASFLEQAILGAMQFDHVDAQGFHFNATLCIPDGASCYLVETLIPFEGEVTMTLLEH